MSTRKKLKALGKEAKHFVGRAAHSAHEEYHKIDEADKRTIKRVGRDMFHGSGLWYGDISDYKHTKHKKARSLAEMF
jgi:hypothetical protein